MMVAAIRRIPFSQAGSFGARRISRKVRSDRMRTSAAIPRYWLRPGILLREKRNSVSMGSRSAHARRYTRFANERDSQ